MHIPYKKILQAIDKELGSHRKNAGLEKILQNGLAEALPSAEREVPLKSVRARTVMDDEVGRIDLVHKGHGIEAKVVQLPRMPAVPSNALYDIGQLSSDYWRLANAKGLDSAELLILVAGKLVSVLGSPSAVYREFHNRMFVDYNTSLLFGELATQSGERHRKRQMSAIKQMGFHLPAAGHRTLKTVVSGSYALISVPVILKSA